ncbi:hypothetical protein JAAARDRAFT_490097 [Jaapia argillacea MUCL 33604]|uniref:Uncharacterized protein n=1 Tax=Jaapia argillacea MUCL 33604 TaxID=933084 RepID=A0A067PP65_9AGAM|nr:hypothetical protein JAAARDRAFT_490097 [Jaapia argillacea MUCL 33604]
MSLQFTVLAIDPLSLTPSFEIITQLTTTHGDFPHIFLTICAVGWARYASVRPWHFHCDSHSQVTSDRPPTGYVHSAYSLDRSASQNLVILSFCDRRTFSVVCTGDYVWFVQCSMQQVAIYPTRQLDAGADGATPTESSTQTYDLGEITQHPVCALPPEKDPTVIIWTL